jgi:S-adenosyl methyltransferase
VVPLVRREGAHEIDQGGVGPGSTWMQTIGMDETITSKSHRPKESACTVNDMPPPSRLKLDTTTPHSARVWNYWLDGKDNHEIDRQVGDQVRQVYPGIVDVALCRLKTRYVVLALGFPLPCYVALRYSLISPPSTFRRRIRPSIGVTARSS